MSETLSLLRAKLARAAGQLEYLPRALQLVWVAARRWTVPWIALLCAQGLVPVAIVYLSRPLVDEIAAAVASGGDPARIVPTLVLAGAMAAALLAGELARSLADWVRDVQARQVEDHVSALIHEKSTTVDLGFYESPEFHDHLHRARDEARYRPIALLESGGGLLQNAITLAAMAAVLLPYGVAMSVALLASTLPALFVVLRFSVLQHRLRMRTTVDERRSHYYDWLMTAGDTAAELRLFGLRERFRSAYQALRARLRGERLQLGRAQAVAELGAAAAALAIAAACVGWMAWRAMLGQVSLGDLALFYLAFSQGQRLMRSLLAGVGQIYYNILFLGNLFEFLDLQARIKDPPHPRAVPAAGASGLEIRFENVDFRYPGSDRVALSGLDLVIPAGQVSAIVGANGAGKSTVLKLLCRFYDPQAGRVALDGIDVRELSLQDLRGLITVLFQQPVRYNASVAENIALQRDASPAEIEAAARAAGADDLVARLPNGYETLLGRWFAGGSELSVGEWQRLALARAFMREAPVVVLDEPTSAMDSWAESDWLRRFRALARGRTAIIVTHRFTTAMQADVIHVMAHGRVTESGTHAQLLDRDGAYAQSWLAQMRSAEACVR